MGWNISIFKSGYSKKKKKSKKKHILVVYRCFIQEFKENNVVDYEDVSGYSLDSEEGTCLCKCLNWGSISDVMCDLVPNCSACGVRVKWW